MRKIFFFLSLSLTTQFLFAQVAITSTSNTSQQAPTISNVVELPSVKIGLQIWTTQNLSVAHYRNGDIIPQVTDPAQWAALTTGAWCWYDNDSAKYDATHGKLYNWYAVNDPRGLAPQGWHIPSDEEWNKLVKYLDVDANTTCSACKQSFIAGGAMKNTTGWNPFVLESGEIRITATNSSGFSCLPGGGRGIDGRFDGIFENGSWWSSTESDSALVWLRQLRSSNKNVYRYNSINKRFGFSVRCIKNLNN